MHAFTHTHTRTLRTSYSVHCKYLCRSDSTGIEFHSTEKVTAIHVFVQLYASYPMYSVQVHMSMDIELPRIADRRRGHRLRLSEDPLYGLVVVCTDRLRVTEHSTL